MPVVTRELLPDTARVEDGELVLGGVRASELAREFGTPVVVYDAATLRANARAYREAAPGALVVYGTKAFPSIAVLQVLAEEGLGADVSTVGELEFALRAGLTGELLVIHEEGPSVFPTSASRSFGVFTLSMRPPARGRRDTLPDPRHARHRGGDA